MYKQLQFRAYFKKNLQVHNTW